MKRGIGIILNIASMPKTINCLLLTTVEVLLPNVQMEWQKKTEERLSNLS